MKTAITHCKRGHEYTPENTMWVTPFKRRCKICNRRWYEGKPTYKAEKHYQSRYGITEAKALELKKSGCMACGTIETKLCIDHNHTTNEIRGVLCDRCNKILGLVDDKVELLEKLIKYCQETPGICKVHVK